ncbi:MAG: choice-of-anchor Q domain-containing protein [Pyrinomonadaceae bacterium]
MYQATTVLKHACLSIVFCILLSGLSAQAATLTITTTADGGSGSLRQALIDATINAEANIVTFNIPTSDPGYDANTNLFTITLLTPLPNIPLAPISLNNFQPQGVRVNGNTTFRIFTLVDSAVVTINNLIISNGFAANGLGGGIYMGNSSTLTMNGSVVRNNMAAGNGGGIYMSNSATIHLSRSTIKDNTAINGGGIFIFDSGTLNIDASTINANFAVNGGNGGAIYNGTSGTINGTSNSIDGNAAANFGGGIYNTATMTLTNNTVSSNSANRGGGIYNQFVATLQNNLIALNTAQAGNDLFGGGPLGGNGFSGVFNLIGNADDSTGLGSAPNRSGTTANPLDPMLGPLQNNGGPTFTRELLVGSPAIDKGNSPTIIADQRGLPRPYDNPAVPNDGGNGSDIGSFEVQLAGVTPTPTATPTGTPTSTPTVTPTATPAGQGFEADVAARPNGDGLILATDVIQIRRFATQLDTPNPATNEHQRADCAPMSSLGDGTIGAGDVVQARRYSAGLDSMNPAGGPTFGPFVALSARIGGVYGMKSKTIANGRAVRISSATGEPGQTITVDISLEHSYREAGASFTVEFDAAKLKNVQVELSGARPTGAILTVNSSEAANGRVGILFDSDRTLAGRSLSSRILTLTFEITGSSASGPTLLRLTDSIAKRSLSNDLGESLEANYIGGIVTIVSWGRRSKK